MSQTSLAAWLERLEQRSPEARIELGLDRVRRVLQRLDLDLTGIPVITVAGTNGKGSTVAYLEAVFQAAGKRVLAYTSPHLLKFSERIRIDGDPASDADIVRALETVERCRENDALTFFEHITLATLVVAVGADVEVLLLEVGLGGRLDAVNVVDPDVAILTSIGLDHTEWLGKTRRAIGREKIGIARPGQPLIVGERRLPNGFATDLEATGSKVARIGRDFRIHRSATGFRLTGPKGTLDLPRPALAGECQLENAACAVMAVEAVRARCPVSADAIQRGLQCARIPGRQQVIRTDPLVMIDVAHNPAAARQLAATLGPAQGPSVAVFSALSDKRVAAMARVLDRCFDHWMVTGLDGSRGLAAEGLAARLVAVPVAGSVDALESAAVAVRHALQRCGRNGRVVVFGSFRTVADAWPELEKLG